MDECIQRINKFIALNNSESFYIKVNVPVSSNIDSFFASSSSLNLSSHEQEAMYDYCVKSAPYHPAVVTRKNCGQLFTVAHYLKEKLNLDSTKIQVMFSENRGVDIGGFFLLLDQTIKEKLPHSYLVKVHTKTHPKWREALLAMLDLKLKDYAPKFGAMYGCQRPCPASKLDTYEGRMMKLLHPILARFKLPKKKSFYFCAGSMFIASSKMTQFFKTQDLLKLYNELNFDYKQTEMALEHRYERFFGYLIEHLRLKTHYCNVFVHPNLM